MGFRKFYIAPMVSDVLCAGKSTLLGEPVGDPSRHERECLVVAEARKHRVLTGKVVIQADVEFPLIEFPRRLVDKVKAQRRVARVACGIKTKHSFTGCVEQSRRDYVAGRAAGNGGLAPVGVGCNGGGAHT